MHKKCLTILIVTLLSVAQSCNSMDPATFCVLGMIGTANICFFHRLAENHTRARQQRAQANAPAQQIMQDQQELEERPLLNVANTQDIPESDEQTTHPPLVITSLTHRNNATQSQKNRPTD